MAVTTNTKEIKLNPDEDFSPALNPDRDAKIAEFAYYKAQNRGFIPGYELQDWLEAEQDYLLQ